MASRYVSTSEKTTIIAKGILLLARVQNMTRAQLHGSEAENEWHSWMEYYPEYVDFVKKEQHALFDRINNEL